MPDRIAEVGVVPSMWLRQDHGSVVTQIGPEHFKETVLGDNGWKFRDFHREVPPDCVPLLAEVHPQHTTDAKEAS